MFSMISDDGQKMIGYIDMQIGNRTKCTIDVKYVRQIRVID